MTSPILNAARKRDTSPEQQRWEAKVYPWSIGNRALWSPKMDAGRLPSLQLQTTTARRFGSFPNAPTTGVEN